MNKTRNKYMFHVRNILMLQLSILVFEAKAIKSITTRISKPSNI